MLFQGGTSETSVEVMNCSPATSCRFHSNCHYMSPPKKHIGKCMTLEACPLLFSTLPLPSPLPLPSLFSFPH